MRETRSWRQRCVSALIWSVLCGVGVGLFFAYRWAEHQRARPETPLPIASSSNVTVRLQNAPFQGYTAGRLAWTLRAAEIVLQRVPGGSLANVASADLHEIREGRLYDIPADVAASLPSSGPQISPPSPRAAAGHSLLSPPPVGLKPAAIFRARYGRYAVGAAQTFPPEMNLLYTAQWHLSLGGDVELRTRRGDRLHAERMTLLELMHRRTWRLERRVLCEANVVVRSGDVEVRSARAEFTPRDRMVTCTDGVSVAYRRNTLRAERLIWLLQEQAVHCPETVQGSLQGTAFTAQRVAIDLKRRRIRAARIHLWIPEDRLPEP
ncbi:MAG: hypothetical protein RMJ43_15430 [Chloroherpetonaceae bacterium]|nr:hypothetical protein [Chloroherpetonaceae bacterium]